MKARVKATGALLEVRLQDIDTEYPYICDMQGEGGTLWKESELEFLDDISDYWTKLEHQYAGMAMQGILANIDLLMSLAKKKADDYPAKYTVAEFAKDCAHALVEKMKEERK